MRKTKSSYKGSNSHLFEEEKGVASYGLFPTLVTVHRETKHLHKVGRLVEKLEYKHHVFNSNSVEELQNLPEFSPLIRYFERCLKIHLQKMGYVVPKMEITQSWANRSFGGERHHRHGHPNSYLSGIYYVKGESGHTVFHSRHTELIQPEVGAKTIWNQPLAYFAPRAGYLLIFPSSLEHSASNVAEGDSRYTISFNALPRGPIGLKSARTFAHL